MEKRNVPHSVHRFTLAVLVAAGLAGGAAAQQRDAHAPPALGFPVDCEYGRTCWIQNYVDLRQGTQAADRACGSLTYDGHAGTDIRLANRARLARDVPVVAAADGIVRAVRDGMPDRITGPEDRARLAGRTAGNGVRLDHGGGWQTQYSHLKQDSVAVREGERVDAGTPLGAVGLSGLTEFPHVEFKVTHRGEAVDPFTGRPPGSGCRADGRALWASALAERLVYVPTALLSAGFAPEAARAERARGGAYASRQFDRTVPALTVWVDVMGPRRGDRQRLRLLAPDGKVLVDHRQRVSKTQAQRFIYAGVRRPDGGWSAGCYRAVYRLERAGRTVVARQLRVGVGSACRRGGG